MPLQPVPDEPLDLVWDPEASAFVWPRAPQRPVVDWRRETWREFARRWRRRIERLAGGRR